MGSSTLIIVGAVLALGAMLVIGRRRGAVAGAGRPGLFARESQEHAHDQLARLFGDVQDVTRERIAQLDTRIRVLQQLLGDADLRIRDLRAAAAPPAPARPANPLHERVYGLADAGKGVGDICAETGMEQGEIELILGLRKVASAH